MADLHESKKYKANILQKLEEDSDYSEEEIQALKDFKLRLEEQGISNRRIMRYLQTFNRLDSEISFSLTDPDTRDVRKLLATINNDLVMENGEEYSPYTLAEFRKGVRKFYTIQKGKDSDLVENLDWKTRPSKSNRKVKSPDEFPGPEEVKEMVRSLESLRNQALVFLLWDTGARISEALHIKWSDVSFREQGARIKIRESKTKPREIPIYEAVQHLKNWKENSPASDSSDHVFVGGRGEVDDQQMQYRAAYKIVKKAADNIGEDYSPHDFRRGRATFLASKGWNAPTMCEYFGWADFSTAEVYINLASKEVEDAMAELQGLETEEEEEESDLRPVKCPHCGELNPATRDYCKNCKKLISEEKELMRETRRDEIRQEVKSEVISSLTEEFGIPEEEIEQSIKEKTRERLEDEGWL